MNHEPPTTRSIAFKPATIFLCAALLCLSFGCSKQNQLTTNRTVSSVASPTSSPAASPISSPAASPTAAPATPTPAQTATPPAEVKQPKTAALPPAELSAEAVLQHIYDHIDTLGVCDGDLDLSLSQEGSSVYPMGQQQYVVELLCFLGAYQGNYEYLLYRPTPDGADVKPLRLAIFEADEAGTLNQLDTRSIAGLPEYDPEQKVLTVMTKYRGLADCGAIAQYKWQDSKFELLEYRSKEECDGNYIEPEQYPKIYP